VIEGCEWKHGEWTRKVKGPVLEIPPILFKIPLVKQGSLWSSLSFKMEEGELKGKYAITWFTPVIFQSRP